MFLNDWECCCTSCQARPASVFQGIEIKRSKVAGGRCQSGVYPAGSVLFLQDEPARSALCIRSGRVKLSATAPDGRTVIVGIAAAGDILGTRALLSGRPHDMTAEVIEETATCAILKDDFVALLRSNSEVALRVAERMGGEAAEAYRQLYAAVFKEPAERLTELLLQFCGTHGEPTTEGIHLRTNLCQDEMAALVGVSRRTLNRSIAKLRRLGIIDCRRKSIVIRDLDALRGWLSGQAIGLSATRLAD